MVSSSIYFKTISIYAHIIQLEFTITLVNPPAVCSVTLATGTLCDRIRILDCRQDNFNAFVYLYRIRIE